MRAGDDGLDALWEIADPAQLPASYLVERRAAVEQFRATNAARLMEWDPGSRGSWREFYRRGQRAQHLRSLPAAAMLVLIGVLLWRAREHGPQGRAGLLFGLLWIAGVLAAGPLAQVALRGSFDLTAI